MTIESSNSSMYERGLSTRKEVLGEAHVEKSLKNASEYSRPMQELVTEYCWGAVWGRGVLPKKSRSLLNLGILTALNRPHEFQVHVRGALTNGCSTDEIREVLLQTAIYVGVPAALEAFRLTEEVFRDQGVELN